MGARLRLSFSQEETGATFCHSTYMPITPSDELSVCMAKPRFLFLHILDFLESREETAFKQINDELCIPQTILRLTLGDLVEQGLAEKKVRGRRSCNSITDRGRSLGAFHQIESFAGYLDFVVADKDVKAKVLKGIEKINANSSEGEVARWYQGESIR